MNSLPCLSGQQQRALLDGLQKICRLFWGPTLENCKALVRGTYFEPYDEIKSFLNIDPPDILQQINVYLGNHKAADSLFNSLESAYVRLFISNKTGIMAPLYESCYEFENAPLMGESAVSMKRRFESKSLSLADSIHEPPDHLCIELEYLYFLLDKGWIEGNQMLINEAASFASETMLPWLSKFQERLAEETECPFYFFIASILTAILQLISGFGTMTSQT